MKTWPIHRANRNLLIVNPAWDVSRRVSNIDSPRYYHKLTTPSSTTNEVVESPGVMQLESNLFSSGKLSPFANAFLIFSSASFADLQIGINPAGQKQIFLALH